MGYFRLPLSRLFYWQVSMADVNNIINKDVKKTHQNTVYICGNRTKGEFLHGFSNNIYKRYVSNTSIPLKMLLSFCSKEIFVWNSNEFIKHTALLSHCFFINFSLFWLNWFFFLESSLLLWRFDKLRFYDNSSVYI